MLRRRRWIAPVAFALLADVSSGTGSERVDLDVGILQRPATRDVPSLDKPSVQQRWSQAYVVGRVQIAVGLSS
jgi:hypothetical protein